MDVGGYRYGGEEMVSAFALVALSSNQDGETPLPMCA